MRVLFADSDGLHLCVEVCGVNETQEIVINVESEGTTRTFRFDSVLEFYTQGNQDSAICFIHNSTKNEHILRSLVTNGYVDLTGDPDNAIFYPDESDIPDLEKLFIKYGAPYESNNTDEISKISVFW